MAKLRTTVSILVCSDRRKGHFTIKDQLKQKPASSKKRVDDS